VRNLARCGTVHDRPESAFTIAGIRINDLTGSNMTVRATERLNMLCVQLLKENQDDLGTKETSKIRPMTEPRIDLRKVLTDPVVLMISRRQMVQQDRASVLEALRPFTVWRWACPI
jgi:hypothetical protein